MPEPCLFVTSILIFKNLVNFCTEHSSRTAVLHAKFQKDSSLKKEGTQIAKFMGPTLGPLGTCQPQMGPMLAPWTLLSGYGWTRFCEIVFKTDLRWIVYIVTWQVCEVCMCGWAQLWAPPWCLGAWLLACLSHACHWTQAAVPLNTCQNSEACVVSSSWHWCGPTAHTHSTWGRCTDKCMVSRNGNQSVFVTNHDSCWVQFYYKPLFSQILFEVESVFSELHFYHFYTSYLIMLVGSVMLSWNLYLIMTEQGIRSIDLLPSTHLGWRVLSSPGLYSP